MRKIPVFALLAALGAWLVATPAGLFAQTGQLDTMINNVNNASPAWLSRVLPDANSIFVKLVALEITFTVLVWAYLFLSGKLSIGGVLSTTVQKVILLVVFSLTMQMFPMFLPKILTTFQAVGGDVAGIKGLSPTALLDQGIYLSSLVFYSNNQAGLFEVPAILASLLLALLLLVCFALLAWRLTALLIEANILLGGGALFLGFGGNRLTIQLAENYIVSLVRLGIHTYLIYFMVAVGNQLVPVWGAQLSSYDYSQTGFALLFRVAGEVLIFTLITLRLPGRLASELTAPSGFLHLRQSLLAAH
jgi:type IV secretion system protein TrbL